VLQLVSALCHQWTCTTWNNPYSFIYGGWTTTQTQQVTTLPRDLPALVCP
jgi:hypothetical protein